MLSDQPVLYANFLSEKEQQWMKDNALHLLSTGRLNKNPAGPNRNFASILNTDMYTKEIHSIYERIVEELGLVDPVIDPLLGILISIVSPGGFVHKHLDNYDKKLPELASKKNMRFNIMVDRGENMSYNPHISGKPFIVNARDAWLFSASHLEHHTPVISGPEKRIIYQFGFCI